jgi:hypothetical protein
VSVSALGVLPDFCSSSKTFVSFFMFVTTLSVRR